jgi:hypothetical protein
MKKERSFGPGWSISGSDFDTHLFYLEKCGTFLLMEQNSEGSLQRVDIIEKEECNLNTSRHMAIQIFANFLLHFLWQSL